MFSEWLSFLPYDKYGLYIISAYGVGFVVLSWLVIQSILQKNKIIITLTHKYKRKDIVSKNKIHKNFKKENE